MKIRILCAHCKTEKTAEWPRELRLPQKVKCAECECLAHLEPLNGPKKTKAAEPADQSGLVPGLPVGIC